MSLADEYPDPGPAPAVGTAGATTKERFDYNDWVKAVRRHLVAKAIDELTTVSTDSKLTPEQTIATVLGRAFLEDTLSSHSFLGGLL